MTEQGSEGFGRGGDFQATVYKDVEHWEKAERDVAEVTGEEQIGVYGNSNEHGLNNIQT